jgi:hypothetical protein
VNSISDEVNFTVALLLLDGFPDGQNTFRLMKNSTLPHRGLASRTFCLGLLLVGLGLACGPARADEIWSSDKSLHFSVSYALATVCYSGLWWKSRETRFVRLTLSVGLALVPGLFKEIHDQGRTDNAFSGLDLLWDVLGAASGGLSMWTFEQILTKRQAAALAHLGVYFSAGPGLAARVRF